MRKAGILVGVVLIIVGIIGYTALQKIRTSKHITSELIKEEGVVEEFEEEPVGEILKEIVEKEVYIDNIKKTTGIEGVLKEEVGILASKNKHLLDKSGMESILLEFKIYTPTNESVSLFVTNSVYTKYEIGTKFKVIYMEKEGVEQIESIQEL